MAGQPCLVASLEMRTQAVAAKLLSVVAGRRWDSMSPTERDPSIAALSEMPIYVLDKYGALAMSDFRAEVEFAVRRFGVRVVVLDHLHFALGVKKPGSDEREMIDAAAFEVQSIALDLNVHIVLVMHPAKLKPDETGRTRDPEIGDLKGSSGPSQLADNVCRIARHESGGSASLKFLKVRSELARLGSVAFKFDLQTLRFEEVEEVPAPKAQSRTAFSRTHHDN
jgi:replicative DNA helicase